MNLSKYSKALVAVGGFFAVLASVLSDGIVGPDEYETVSFAALTAVFVYLKKNTQ